MSLKKELKLKARVDNPEEVKKRIASFALFLKRETYADYFFTLPKKGPAELRLRKLEKGKVVTLKINTGGDGVQENMEYTFSVDHADHFVTFLEFLGFEALCMARKKAQLYDYKDITISLVSVENQGSFVEIVAHCKDQYKEQYKRKLLEIYDRLGLSQKNIDSRYYCRILKI